MNPSPTTQDRPLVNTSIVKWHFIAAMTFITIALLAGLTYSTQFLHGYPFKNISWLSPGRVRMMHTNLIFHGFIFNSFLGGMYWIVPRLTGVPVLSDKLATILFYAWQAIVTATAVGLLAGQAQAIEWGETPIWIDHAVVIAVVLIACQLMYPIIKTPERSWYVTLWYVAVAWVWIGPTYIMGNGYPQFYVPGTEGAAISRLFIHNLIGLFVTPVGFGLMYYFVPVILNKPIFSHALALVGVWGLVFFYPANGIYHILRGPDPTTDRFGAMIGSIAVAIVALTVIVNFFLTLRHRGAMLKKSVSIRWFCLGMVFYVTTCVQIAFQITPTIQPVIHFTDWVVGHSHLAMFGVFGFWNLGMITHLWPKLVGAGWYSNKLNAWTFWLSGLGMFVMFFDLVAAGLMQGYVWQALAPWEDSLVYSAPFWHLRAFSGVMIIVGIVLLLVNMTLTAGRRTT